MSAKQGALDYEGPVPEFKYFSGITYNQYLYYCKDFIEKNWSLKDETIKYCKQDCKTLYEVLN